MAAAPSPNIWKSTKEFSKLSRAHMLKRRSRDRDVKLLHILSSIDPNGGGPTEGVRQRGIRLTELGHTVEVVSLDDPAEAFVKEFPLTVHALGPPRGRYRYTDRLVAWLT